MANDKNNSNNLDANSDEDTTPDFEFVSGHPEIVDEEAEADANTYAFDEADPVGHSVESLRSDLRSRDERIGQLQFDVEQLRARWTGLEKEITAREEVTKFLQDDLRAADKRYRKQEKRLKAQDRELETLTANLEAAKDVAQQFEELTNQIRAAEETDVEESINAENSAIDALQRQIELERITIAELEAYIDGRQLDWDKLNDELVSVQSDLASKDDTVKRLQEETEHKTHLIDTAKSDIETLKTKMAKERATSKALSKKNRALANDTDRYPTDHQFNMEKRLAEQSGRLASNRHEIKELKGQIARSEQYADELRARLSDVDALSTNDQTRREQLELSFEQSNRQLLELRDQLDSEKLVSARLAKEIDALEADFEQELRQTRFELGAAQDTIGDYETINEELASDLIDNTHFRQALEEQLSSTEKTRDKKIAKLTLEIKKLKTQLNDSERKISSKDSAITALLSELANKSQSLESIGDIGSVIHEIDNKMSERIDDRSGQDKDRPARLLIGVIDGQELQFPLFKNRLTIGRSMQNDIQLKAQYISRRHAVILSDEDGPRIIDWGSKNGILVNDRKVLEQRLNSGDKVTIGTAEFVFEERYKR